MDILEESLPAEPPEQDEFASGPPNRLRAAARRLVGWIFGPPYFLTGLVWLLLALVAANSAAELLVQPGAYWVDFSTSTYHTFLGTQLQWGWGAIAAYAGYMLAAGLVLSLIRSRLAFALWAGLAVYHLVNLVQLFDCKARYFPFETPENCANTHTAAMLFAGLICGAFLAVAARYGSGSRAELAASPTASPGPWAGRLRAFSIALIALLGLAVLMRAVFAPRPAWQQIQSAQRPSARTEVSLAYDTHRSMAVLFGGTARWTPGRGWESSGETWEWDGLDWSMLHPEHSPSPRYGAGMAFDEKRRVAVMFGGMSQVSELAKTFWGDTWEWDGQDWQEKHPPASPPARYDQAMIFDPLRGNVVMYGGYYVDPETQIGVFLDDAWEWDGETWEQLRFDQPRINSGSGMVYDPLRQSLMLMDGEGLWAWQEAEWTPLNFPGSPPARWGTQMVYNPEAERVILFGGSVTESIFDDTWSYDGQTWQLVVTRLRPPRRSGHSLFYDQTLGRVVLFGGLDGGQLYNDMWELVQP